MELPKEEILSKKNSRLDLNGGSKSPPLSPVIGTKKRSISQMLHSLNGKNPDLQK